MRVAFQKADQSMYAGLIRWWTKSEYSHCELLFSDGMMFSSHVADKGTRYVKNQYFNYLYWDVLEIPITDKQEKVMRDFCDSELYCRYDWWGIWFSQIIRMQREDPEKWFCSEICTTAWQRIGFLGDSRPCTFSPGKLYKRMREAGAQICVP